MALGADAVGFVFAPSPRQVTPQAVDRIIHRLPREILTVGVFRDEAPKRVVRDHERDRPEGGPAARLGVGRGHHVRRGAGTAHDQGVSRRPSGHCAIGRSSERRRCWSTGRRPVGRGLRVEARRRGRRPVAAHRLRRAQRRATSVTPSPTCGHSGSTCRPGSSRRQAARTREDARVRGRREACRGDRGHGRSSCRRPRGSAGEPKKRRMTGESIETGSGYGDVTRATEPRGRQSQGAHGRAASEGPLRRVRRKVRSRVAGTGVCGARRGVQSGLGRPGVPAPALRRSCASTEGGPLR